MTFSLEFKREKGCWFGVVLILLSGIRLTWTLRNTLSVFIWLWENPMQVHFVVTSHESCRRKEGGRFSCLAWGQVVSEFISMVTTIIVLIIRVSLCFSSERELVDKEEKLNKLPNLSHQHLLRPKGRGSELFNSRAKGGLRDHPLKIFRPEEIL